MRPLEGIKVVEFATYVVVPVAARLLADWGAEVIKIEAPTGDAWRLNGNNLFELPANDEANPDFSVHNSGKKFVSLNLKDPAGREALMKILEDADIFMTNIRYAGINRLGLDWETIHEKFPKLIYYHFNGWGYEGPWKDRPGFDSASFWAASGLLAEVGERDTNPMYTAPGAGDIATSGLGLSGILAALHYRDKTGEGLRLSTSLFASGIWHNYSRVIGTQPNRADGKTAPLQYPSRPEELKNPLSNIYRCKDDRWILLASGYTRAFQPLMPEFGLEWCLTDERFCTQEAAYEHSEELYHLLVEAFKTKTSDEWAEIFERVDIVFQKLAKSEEISSSEQAWANDYLTNLECPNGMKFVVPNSPVTFFGMERPHTQHTSGVGAHTAEVLAQCGYTEEQIAALVESGAAATKQAQA